MTDISRDAPDRPTEGERRLHAMVRTMLSPGIWLVLLAQFGLVFSLQWRVAADAAQLDRVLAILLPTLLLFVFLYLQAGALQSLTLSRASLQVGDILREGKKVFIAFVWLTLKAGLLGVLVMNVIIYFAVVITGQELKVILGYVAPLLNPLVGVVSFAFIYWLPFVFVRREFHLFPSLKAALDLFWTRKSHAAFLALLVFAPILVSVLLPEGLVVGDFLISLAGGMMSWIAYIYCVEVLLDNSPVIVNEASV